MNYKASLSFLKTLLQFSRHVPCVLCNAVVLSELRAYPVSLFISSLLLDLFVERVVVRVFLCFHSFGLIEFLECVLGNPGVAWDVLFRRKVCLFCFLEGVLEAVVFREVCWLIWCRIG